MVADHSASRRAAILVVATWHPAAVLAFERGIEISVPLVVVDSIMSLLRRSAYAEKHKRAAQRCDEHAPVRPPDCQRYLPRAVPQKLSASSYRLTKLLTPSRTTPPATVSARGRTKTN